MIQSCQGTQKFQNPLSRKRCYEGTSLWSNKFKFANLQGMV